MLLFPNGIWITRSEYQSASDMVGDVEVWLLGATAEKARLRREALINEWSPTLKADDELTELPNDEEQLCELIMGRDDYRSRLQRDAAESPPVGLYNHNLLKFEARPGASSRRYDGGRVTLYPRGMEVSDIDCGCILAYVQDVDDWIIGALVGQINRGKHKKDTTRDK